MKREKEQSWNLLRRHMRHMLRTHATVDSVPVT